MALPIQLNLVKPEKYSIKCPNTMTPIGICVHNTANDANAKGEISYMVGNNLKTSFHFAVDDIEVWQGLPIDRHGWHAGDGNGDGNLKHIGIEICYSKSGGAKFAQAEENASDLIAYLLKQKGWGIERVKKHQDFSGKYCPHRTLDLGWDRFLNMIKTKLSGNSGAPVTGGNMTHQQFYEKFLEAYRKHKNDVEWGDDKNKPESVLLDDPAVIGRMIDSIASDKRKKEARIKELESQPIPPTPPASNPTKPVTDGWTANGLTVEETIGNTKIITNYKK